MSSHSSNFAYAMTNSNSMITTANGAVSLSNPDVSGETNGRLSLLFKSVRGLNVPVQYDYMIKSSKENIIDTFLLAFHIRDCRGGKGERDIGRRCLIWLFINYPDLFSNIVKFIPEYGRWDDIIHFFPIVLDLSNIEFVRVNYVSYITEARLSELHILQKQLVKIFTDKIREDHLLMLQGLPCSLAAKWAPSEGDSLDRNTGVYMTIAKEMNISPRILRKKYLSPLRAYLKIVERYMCDGKWDDIDYNKVPSCSMKRLKKSFEKHDAVRFDEWRSALKKGNPKMAKVNSKQLFPHELVREMRIKCCADDVCSAQWSILEDECMKNGLLDNDLAVVDTSASMYSNNYIPYDVACAIGLLISKCSVGKFKHHVMTFSTNPSFVVLDDRSIYERYNQLQGIAWSGSTNIQKIFILILEKGKLHGLTQNDMPKRLWILSDMQFDKIDDNNDITNFQAIDKMYNASGYTRPNIIFWNINGSSNDFPVSVDDNGTALISGFSPSIMNSILNCNDNFSSYNIMRRSLDDKRLTQIRNALEVLKS